MAEMGFPEYMCGLWSRSKLVPPQLFGAPELAGTRYGKSQASIRAISFLVSHDPRLRRDWQMGFLPEGVFAFADKIVNLANVRAGADGAPDWTTVEARDIEPEDHLTAKYEHRYQPLGGHFHPFFERFFGTICCNDPGLVAHLGQRIARDLLTPRVADKKAVFLLGDCNNGKTTLLHAVRTVAGATSVTVANPTLLTEKQQGSGPTPEVTAARDARIVIIEEPAADGSNACIQADRFKALVGRRVRAPVPRLPRERRRQGDARLDVHRRQLDAQLLDGG